MCSTHKQLLHNVHYSLLSLIFFIFHFSFYIPAKAQQPWNYESIEEACLDDAYLVSPPGEICLDIEKHAIGKVEYNSLYHVSGPYNTPSRWPWEHDAEYIRFQNAEHDFRLPMEDATKLLPYLVSRSYWQERFDVIRCWDFIDTTQLFGFLKADTAGAYGRYCNIAWLGFDFQSSDEWPVCFIVSLGVGEPQRLSLSAMERLAQWGVFATYSDWHRYAAGDADVRRRHEDMLYELQQHVDSLTKVSTQLARQADSMTTALLNDSLAAVAEQSRAEVERLKERMNRNEIFIMSINPARSEYMFGMEFNLYNCFQKTISKIEITVTPYNDRSRVQQDKFGRSTRTVRCMGPVHPGSPAQYSFDELYWNDQSKIKYMRVTGIVFYFTDGTTQSYSGYSKILKHSLN